MKRFFSSRVSLILIVIWGIIAIGLVYVARLSYQKGLENLAEEGIAGLELYVTYLQGVLGKYESLPELMVTDKRMIEYFLKPGGKERIDALNNYLETINRISNASDTYLMDREGLTIAASNWNEPRPFVGRNFSYRPYFKESMEGHLGRYFALGTTSSRRGYYFAYPVRHDGQILGALVIKIDIDSVEQTWGQKKQSFIITDPDGVVFLTTNQDWRFHTLYPLSEETRKRVEESKRYLNASLTPFNITEEKITHLGRIITIRNINNFDEEKYLLQSRYMEEAGWNVQILSDTKGVEQFVILEVTMLSTLFIFGGLLHLLIRQRRERLEEAKRFELQSRRILEETNEKLESRVSERTTELTNANLLLRNEVEVRRKAEHALQKTRSELIHAAKLAALGQMSAGINHELNQPLAAIRSYSDNCKLFLSKGRLDDAISNLEQISELTDRMARIGVQLKLFSRKSSGQINAVPLHSALDGALEILKPALRKVDADINVTIIPESLEAKANNVLLQQVLVNLIGNALQAVEDQKVRKIDIIAQRRRGRVMVSVQDSGKGIDSEHLPHIFEPFYTTKKSGHGLGLGLTITERIIGDMNGEIQVGQSLGGARFEFFLEEAEGHGDE